MALRYQHVVIVVVLANRKAHRAIGHGRQLFDRDRLLVVAAGVANLLHIVAIWLGNIQDIIIAIQAKALNIAYQRAAHRFVAQVNQPHRVINQGIHLAAIATAKHHVGSVFEPKLAADVNRLSWLAVVKQNPLGFIPVGVA